MTYLELIKTFKSISLSQPNVHSFVRQFDDLNREDAVYSAIILQDQQHAQAGDFINYSFYIGYTDRLTEDTSNEDSVISTEISIINNIVNTLREIYPYDVYLSNYNVFQQRFTALCAGAYSTITISIPAALCTEDISGLDTLSTTITENGDYNFVPDGLGFDSVHVVVDVQPEVSLEERSVSINENGQVIVTTTPGFTGMSKVNIDVAIPQEEFDVHPTTTDQRITPREGYTFGGGTVRAVTSDIDVNITSDNIKNGVTILGVEGTFKGEKPEERFNVQPSTVEQTITPSEGKVFSGGTVHAVTSDIDKNIVTDNIRKGVTILGVEGTFKGEKPEEEFNVQPTTSDQTITPTEGSVFSGGTVHAVTADIDKNIVSSNIREGVTVLGVAGTLKEEKPEERFNVQPSTTEQTITPTTGSVFSGGTVKAVTAEIDKNIVSNNIREGVTVLGVKGTLKEVKPEERFNVQPSTVEQIITPNEGSVFSGGTVKAVTAGIDSNIIPENIKTGVTVLGVEGTLKVEKPEERFNVQPSTVEQIITPNEGSVFSGGTVRAVTADIDKNIVPNNVREGITVLGVNGTLKEVKPEETFDIQPTTTDQTITPTDGSVFSRGTVRAVTAEIDKNIVSNNVREGITILGVKGTLKEVKPEETFDIQPTTTDQAITPTEGSVFSRGTVKAVTANIDNNIVSNNIREGINILGVAGTLKEEKPEEVFDIQPTTSDQTITPTAGSVFSRGTVRAVTSSIDNNIQPENIREGVTVLGVEGTLKDVFVVPNGMKFGNSDLTKFPSNLDFSNVTQMGEMFADSYIEYIPRIDTSRAIGMRRMFAYCPFLKAVEGIDFSGLTEDLIELFGTSTSKLDLTRFIVNGKINVSISDNYSIKALNAIDYDSVKSILEAASRTDNTNAKTLAFNREISDPNGELSALVASCTSKGWTITGLTRLAN